MSSTVALAVSAHAPAVQEVQPEFLLPPAPAHLEFFGFAIVDCGFDDPLDREVKTNYLDEVAAFSNIAQICPLAIDEDMGPRLAAFDAAGVQALLSVDGVLFDFALSPASPSGLQVNLSPDYLARWSTFVAANTSNLTPEFIAAISIVDEPFWNGLTATELQTTADLIQATLPAIPTLVVEAGPAVQDLVVPTSVDWVAFDHYGIMDPTSDPLYLSELATLKSKLSSPTQRILLVPEAQWLPQYTSLGLTPADMGDVFLNYFVLAYVDRQVVGMITYLWPGGFDEPGQLGARELPAAALAKIRAVGRSISGR